MTAKQVDRRAQELRALLQVDHWYLMVHLLEKWKSIPHNPGHTGEVTYMEHDTYAFINVAAGRTDEEIDETLCHEMAHVRLRELDAIADAIFSALPDDAASSSLMSLWNSALERACQGFANALKKRD